ncbi:hypothetical protein [Kribbella sp. CA-247076]|uniref:hypothetical protein n=1 Tax=Kribbella sp. CA-247076 TaxID=3239941 RepID=UPI003D93C9CC
MTTRDASGADDYRMLLTVIAGIALGVAATALPALIEGPFLDWTYAAKVVLWFTGIGANVLEYLAVSFGSRLYLTRVEVFATASLALVFLAQAGLFVVLSRGRDDLLASRWFSVFAIFCVLAAIEANHGRRIGLRYGGNRFPAEVVDVYTQSLRQVVVLLLSAAAVSVGFAVLGQWAPGWLTFLFALAALAVIVGANVHQERTRNALAAYGVLPGRYLSGEAPAGD